MQYRSSHLIVTLAVVFIALPLLAFPQEPPPAEKQTPKDQPPKLRLDLYGDPLPTGALARLGSTELLHAGHVLDLAYSMDGKSIVSASTDGYIRVFDALSGLELHRWGDGKPIYGAAISQDGRTIIACRRELIEIWDAEKGQKVGSVESGGRPNWNSLAISANGKTLIDGGPRLWDVMSRTSLPALEAAPIGFGAVALSPDGDRLVGAKWDGPPHLWEAASGEQIFPLGDGVHRKIRAVSFSRDGRILAAAGFDQRLSLLNAATGKKIRSLQGECWQVTTMDFSPDGKWLAGGRYDWQISVWDTETGAMRTFGKGVDPAFEGRSYYRVRFSPDGSRIAAGGHGTRIQIWDWEKGTLARPNLGHDDFVTALAFSPDGRVLASGGGDGAVILWDVSRRRPVCKIDAHSIAVLSLAYSPDGVTLATGGQDESFRLWNPKSGERFGEFKATARSSTTSFGGQGDSALFTPRAVRAVRFSADGEALFGGCQDGSLWKFQPGPWRSVAATRMREPDSDEVWNTFNFDPARTDLWQRPWEKTAAIAFGGTHHFYRDDFGSVHLLDVSSSEHRHHLTSIHLRRGEPGDEGSAETIASIAVDPFGVYLGSVGRKGTVALWDLSTEQKVWQRSMDSGGGTTLAFSPDGATIGVGHFKGGISLYENRPGAERLLRLDPPGGSVLSLAFSLDGTLLASGGVDGLVYLWTVGDVTSRRSGNLDPIDARGLERAWKNLAKDDAQEAYEAVRCLAAHPDQVVLFLRNRLLSRPEIQPERVKVLVEMLSDDSFEIREEAASELRRMGDQVTGALARVLAASPDPETAVRIRSILDSFYLPIRQFPSDDLRVIRSIIVLASIGSKESTEVLRELSEHGLSSLIRDQAREAVNQLKLR